MEWTKAVWMRWGARCEAHWRYGEKTGHIKILSVAVFFFVRCFGGTFYIVAVFVAFFLLFCQHSRRSCGSVSTWNAAAYAHWAPHASTVGCGLRWSVSRAMPSIDLRSTVSKIVFHLKLLCVRIVFIISIVRKHSVCAHLFHLSKFLLNVLFSPSLYNIFLRQSIVFNINFLNGCCLLNRNRKEMKYVVSRHAFVWFRHSAVLFSDAYPLS